MSISTGVIIAVAFQKVDRAPDTKTCTEGYYQSLQNTDCAVEKIMYNNLRKLKIA